MHPMECHLSFFKKKEKAMNMFNNTGKTQKLLLCEKRQAKQKTYCVTPFIYSSGQCKLVYNDSGCLGTR